VSGSGGQGGGARAGASALPVEAVVVAAGSSRRMAGQDKLEAKLRGRSLLRWSVEAMAAGGSRRIVIVTAPERVARIAGAEWLPDTVVAVVAGGERRQESVAAGVAALAGAAPAGGAVADPVILVHDAARPLASPDLVRAVAEAAARYGAAIPVLPVAETLKRLDGERIGTTLDRTDVVAAQTPQGVRRSLIAKAYESYPPDGPETWTDEASLLEACRIPVRAIFGEATNLKVTVPLDLERARAVLEHGLVPGRPPAPEGPPAPELSTSSARSASPEVAPFGRIGLGIDSHPFGTGGPLVLGGIEIEGAPRLAGHSDGDVVLHAVADALLGAAGLGDLGRLFPADSRTPAGIDSSVLLAAVGAKVRAAGWRPVNVDLTIVAARPKLAPLLPKMAARIAGLLELDAGSVNVKASTGNLEGSEGGGRTVSATAIASIAPLLSGAQNAPPAPARARARSRGVSR
jgi:2-C-methyl-D-erythritol 4-phosphate cytidylyltransferase/2-C-methyl-D-erythritol 2,4-cyclodiphosphate synthase